MKMGKFRITLIPHSEYETVTGKGLEKCSVVVTDPCGYLENIPFQKFYPELCSARKILGNDSVQLGSQSFPCS